MFKFLKLCGSLFNKVQGIKAYGRKENVDIVDCKNEGTMQRHLAEDGHPMTLVSVQKVVKKCQNNLVLNFFFLESKIHAKIVSSYYSVGMSPRPVHLKDLVGSLRYCWGEKGWKLLRERVRSARVQLLMPFLSLLPDHRVNRCLPFHHLCTCPVLPQYQDEIISIPCFFMPHE